MHIDYNILIAYGGVVRKMEKGDFVYHEGAMPYFFYQVVEGSVKVFSSNAEGKELIQGVFTAGKSFGEPPLLLDKPYPTTAQAQTPCVIVKMSRDNMLHLFKDYPELPQKLMMSFAERIYQKSMAAQIWISHSPEEKISLFLKNFKTQHANNSKGPVPYTRQQIADFTGLRVETVIRTLSRMNQDGKVKIIDHKLFY